MKSSISHHESLERDHIFGPGAIFLCMRSSGYCWWSDGRPDSLLMCLLDSRCSVGIWTWHSQHSPHSPGTMWSTLTLHRPKHKKPQSRSVEKSGLRRSKTFCDTEAGSEDQKSAGDLKTGGSSRTWLNNIKHWRKKLLRNEINFPEDHFSRSVSGSGESLDQVR